MMTRKTVPARYRAAGQRLHDAVAGTYELTEPEQVLLDSACRHVDMIERLEELLEHDLTAPMATSGARRLNPAVAELRQHRLALSKLLVDLALPPDAEAPVVLASPASLRASRAAQARHDRARRQASRGPVA